CLCAGASPPQQFAGCGRPPKAAKGARLDPLSCMACTLRALGHRPAGSCRAFDEGNPAKGATLRDRGRLRRPSTPETSSLRGSAGAGTSVGDLQRDARGRPLPVLTPSTPRIREKQRGKGRAGATVGPST
ncbi:unnamed protein product, partial [Amoebophrya sp. A25]